MTTNPSTTFGTVPNQIQRMTSQRNTISDTAAGAGNGQYRDPRQRGYGRRQRQHARAEPSAAARIDGTKYTQSNNTDR